MTHHNFSFLVVACGLSTLAACGGAAGSPAPPLVATSAAAESSGRAWAQVDGVAISPSMIPTAVHEQIRDIENELQQRRLHMQWAGVEEAIDGVLLTREAERRNISVAQLRVEEIDAQAPGDDEVRQAYEANQDVIGVPFEVAAPYLKEQLLERRQQDAESAYLATLRQSVDVTYALPIPELPRVLIDITDAPSEGPDDARVVLVEFSDFQCPYCGRARATLRELRQMYPQDLKIVFLDFPLEQHRYARPAAEAAHCAHQQGKFWEYHDLLFDHQEALSDSDLDAYAAQVNLDSAAFASCRTASHTKDVVAASLDAGRRYGVNGTPALFLNGMKLIGLMPVPLLKMLIDSELSR